jgi:protein ImuB
MRVAALRVPDFSLQALRRSEPELVEAPLVVAAGPSPRDVVIAVSAEAIDLGARVGTTVAQVRQVAPAVLVRVTPAEVSISAGEALADVAAGFSPRVKRHAPGEMLLDVGGLVPHFGREDDVAHELLRACRHVGLEARVGIASSVGVARAAAATGEAVVVRPGQEAAFLAPLPVQLLEPGAEVAVTLARWGLRIAGEVAQLSRQDVALRLGPEGIALHRLACGEETSAFVPDPLRETLREGVELDFPLGVIEQCMFVANGVLARLGKRLELRGEGFAEVLFELDLESGGRREYRLKLVAPTREVPAVLALARLQLEAAPPGAAVEGVVAHVTPGRVRLMQGSLFGPLPAPGKLSMVLARLAALVGPERVGLPSVPDTHRPGAWSVRPFVLPEDRGQGSGAGGQRCNNTEDTCHPFNGAVERVPGAGSLTPVLRAYRPPREAKVDAVGGRPVVVWVGERGGIVVGWAGPYRFAGDWWAEAPFARDDFDIATSDGSLLRIYFDRLSRSWFVDGQYD